MFEIVSPIVDGDNLLTQSVGGETSKGFFRPVLRKGCKMPCSVSEVAKTVRDAQTSMAFSLFLGDSKMANENQKLGVFEIIGFDTKPAGMVQIRVFYSVQGKSVVISAQDEKSGKQLSVRKVSS